MNETEALTGADFASISGVNAEDGLRRVSGNVTLYIDLLRQFVDRQSGSADRILSFLRSGDFESAQRDAHTVKGVAGTIGASEVQAAAGELERAIRDRATDIEALRGEFASLLEPLTRSLTRFLETHVKEAPSVDDGAVPPDVDVVKSVVQKFLGLLEDSDADAIDLLREQRAAVRYLFTPEGFSSFEHLVTGYSFDEAADELRRAAAEKGL